MNEQLREQLRLLRLPGFIEALDEQLRNNSYGDLSFEERMTFMVERECLRRDNQRLNRRLKTAELLKAATLDQVDFVIQRGLPKKKFLELAELHWLTQHHNLIIVGPTGAGKSFLASVLGDQACKRGFAVRRMKTAKLIEEIASAKADGSYPKFNTALARTELLIIEEWLREPLSEQKAGEILDLIDDRFRNSSLLLTTQFPVDDWYQRIKEPTLAEAMLDRLIHDSFRLELHSDLSVRDLTSKVPKDERSSKK